MEDNKNTLKEYVVKKIKKFKARKSGLMVIKVFPTILGMIYSLMAFTKQCEDTSIEEQSRIYTSRISQMDNSTAFSIIGILVASFGLNFFLTNKLLKNCDRIDDLKIKLEQINGSDERKSKSVKDYVVKRRQKAKRAKTFNNVMSVLSILLATIGIVGRFFGGNVALFNEALDTYANIAAVVGSMGIIEFPMIASYYDSLIAKYDTSLDLHEIKLKREKPEVV